MPLRNNFILFFLAFLYGKTVMSCGVKSEEDRSRWAWLMMFPQLKPPKRTCLWAWMTAERTHPRVCCQLHNWNLRATRMWHLVSNASMVFFQLFCGYCWLYCSSAKALEVKSWTLRFIHWTWHFFIICLCQYTCVAGTDTAILSNVKVRWTYKEGPKLHMTSH